MTYLFITSLNVTSALVLITENLTIMVIDTAHLDKEMAVF